MVRKKGSGIHMMKKGVILEIAKYKDGIKK